MKHLNFLSNLLSLSLGSPCTDVSLDRRLTVGSPSGRYCSGLMRLVFILAILLTVGVGNVWGTDITYTFSGASWTATSGGNAANWTSGSDGAGYSSGVQITTGASGANATSPSSFTSISNVRVNYHQNNSDGAGSIAIQVGTGTEKSYSVSKPAKGTGTTSKYHDFAFSPVETGNVKITVTCSKNSIYIESIVISYTASTTYTLTFKEWNGGGAASGSPSTGSVTANATSFSFGATAPSKTGHTIEGFYTNTSASSGVKVANSSRQFVASVASWTNASSQYTKGANANLYIKWSPKVCAITLDKGTGGTSNGSVSYTYGNSSKTGAITHATKTGYHLNGYYTASSGGTKILNDDGTIAGNSIVVSTTTYTDASGNWAYDGTSLTLYAQWTIDNYTVHWKVNDEDWEGSTHGSPSTNANYNTKPATIPTAPVSGDCDGTKVFVGWTNSTYSHASSAPSILFTSQSSAPAITGNTTFHAVFANRSGSAPVASTITGSYASHTGWTESNSICTGGSGSDTYWVLCTGGTLTSPIISDLSTVTSITFSARTYGGSSYKTINVKTSGNTSVGSANASSNALTSGYSISVSGLTGSGSLVFSSSTTAASSGPGIDAITINYTTGGYTYSNYATTCCTALGSINGSVSWTNPTEAVLTWNKMSNVADSDPYTISYRTGSAAYGTTNVGDVDLTGSKATCTITGLNCNTNYDFKIEVAADDGYCDKDTTMTGKNSGKWTITRSGSPAGTVTGGTFTTKISGSAVTGACSGDQIDIVATNANGYAFSSWTVGKEGGGSVTPNAATASTYFSMSADNVTVTAAFSCVQPSFTVHPASKTDYLTTESATALGYTASAAGASLTQQWQSSSDNSSWSNIVGATNSTYTPDISSEGTTYYRVIVTNSACSESRTSNVATITSVTPSVCKTPTFSVDEGTYNTSKSVSLNCATDGATIYYTTDNSTPTAESTEYTGAISVTQTTTIKAIAVADGLEPSLVASATYTIQCATPTFSVTAGTYVGSKSVEISTTYGTTIYYTTNGDNPTTGSTAYSSAITVGTSQTVKAIAVKSGCTNSAVGSAAYTIQCAAPTFSPTAGTYNANQTVYLSSTYGDNFYYTLDNSTPTTESTLYDSKTGISITASKTLKAIATKTGCDNSSVSSATYTMKCATPTFDVTAGTYTGEQTVAISSTTPGVSIYYTTNGAMPTTSSTAYSSAITVSTNQTVKAIAVKDGWTNSDVGQAAYTIQYAVTWKVNDVALTGDDLGSASTLVTYNSKVTNLPPDPDDDVLNNCANKFMGWSKKDAGSTAKTTSYYDDLFTTAAGSTAITGATTFYAVFAETSEDELLSEDFSSITDGNSTSTSGSSSAWTKNDNFGTLGYVYKAGGAVRIGAGNNAGSLPTKTMDLRGGTIIVTFKMKGWDSDEKTVKVQVDNGTPTSVTCSDDMSGDFAEKSVSFDAATASSYVKFTTTSGVRVFLDDISVVVKSAENYVTQCAANQVRVTYDFNGGTGTACSEGVTTKSASYTVCSTEPEKNYYDFAGWSDGTNTYGAGDTYNLQATTEFTATWTPTVYTITYNLNGGTQQVTPAAPTSYTYESSAVTLPTPTKGHSRFDGWYANSNLSTGGVQTTIAAGSNGNKVYYAKWTDRHEIKFYADDNLLTTIYRASDENLQASVTGQGSKPSNPSAPSDCSSKVFMGWTETWFNDETDTEPADLNDATGTRSEDKTYYAVWATRAGSPGSYTYSAYSTTCCGKSVEVDGGSPSNGTVTFDKSYAWTCKGDREIIMTITPASGYQLATFSVATGDGKVAAKSMSADVALYNNSSAAQVITLTFAEDADGAYDVTATFAEMTVTSWTWTYNSSDIPDPIDVYVGQKRQIDVVMSPSGVLSSHKNKDSYIHAVDASYIGYPTHAAAYFTFEGKAATASTPITLTHKDDTSEPKAFALTFNVRVTALPTVTFIDQVHNKTDFTVGDDDLPASGIMSAVVSGDKWTVTTTRPTPNHADVAVPVSGNTCEQSHLHLVGWIDKDWADEHPDATHSEILGAGTGVFYAANADIDLSVKNGKTFLAVWSKIE